MKVTTDTAPPVKTSNSTSDIGWILFCGILAIIFLAAVTLTKRDVQRKTTRYNQYLLDSCRYKNYLDSKQISTFEYEKLMSELIKRQ